MLLQLLWMNLHYLEIKRYKQELTVFVKLTNADLHFFTFIKYLFTQRDLLHTGWLVEKMINHVAVIWTIKFNVKQVKEKPLKVRITWKFARCLEFYIFPKIICLKLSQKKILNPFLWMGFNCIKSHFEEASLLFTIKFPKIASTQFIDFRKMKGWDYLGATHWFWTPDPWIRKPAP